MTIPKKFPKFLYGTAWKEERTEDLVSKAIKLGFRGIDTANQRVHYFEEAVGNAIKKAINLGIKREELFLQTKFTYANGQDHRIPYDINTNFQTQVNQSFQSSLDHLNIDYIDSYILHGPATGYGLTDSDLEVWKQMESLKNDGKIKYLGISNVNIDQLKELYNNVEIKPTFVQNRCFASTRWDLDIRKYCKENNITYQGFSLLTANTSILTNQKLKDITNKHNKTPAQVIFRFSMQVGILPITGTCNETHMLDDLSCDDFDLNEKDLKFIENISVY